MTIGTSVPRFIHDLLDNAAGRWPEKVAIHDGNGAWTYAELEFASRQYAAGLRAANVGAGDRVLISAFAERWVIAAIYACSRIGAVAVPLTPDLRPAQLQQITDDAEPALILTGPPGPATGAVTTSPVSPDAPTLFLYTSGSTGLPKAVMCPHQQILFVADAIAGRIGYRHDDVILCRLPLSFDYGLYQEFMAAAVGATVVLRGPGQDGGLIAAVQEHAVTVVPVVPSLATVLIQLGRRGVSIGVRLVTNTGQELARVQLDGLRRTFPTAAVQLMYGITECKRVSIADPDADQDMPGSVGKALSGTGVVIVDSHGRPILDGGEGQIVVRGPHLMSGYWRDDQLTAQTYRQNPATGERELHTGDYGHMDVQGNLYFHGRRDHLFKQRGVRTSVTEIEAAALQIPQVSDAALIPPLGDREAVLFAVTTLDPKEVLQRLRERLEAAKVPAICRILPSLPLGSTGKIDRGALRNQLDENLGENLHV